MKDYMKIKLGLILLMMAIVLASGCVSPTEEDRVVGQISIRDLLENREKYNGTDVVIKGRIVTQCINGCNFNVNDNTGVIFVEMKGEAGENPIPQSIGKTVEVRGTFYKTPRPHIIVVKVGDVIVR